MGMTFEEMLREFERVYIMDNRIGRLDQYNMAMAAPQTGTEMLCRMRYDPFLYQQAAAMRNISPLWRGSELPPEYDKDSLLKFN